MNKTKSYDLSLFDFFPDSHVNVTHSPNPEAIHGSSGDYRVSFSLRKPNSPISSELQRKHAELGVGESHLKFRAPSQLSVTLENSKDNTKETVEIELVLNETGSLGKLLCPRISGSGFDDVVTKGYRAVSMLLSQYSLFLDVPLYADQVDSTELSTQISRVSLLTPFLELEINSDLEMETGSPELSNYASYYREGLNSNSVAYKFLCFFKIIEGIHEMRNRINAEKRQKGLEPWRPAITESIPQSENEQIAFLERLFPYPPVWAKSPLARDTVFIKQAVGKRVSTLFSGKLNDIRVQIAHGLTKTGEPTISLDELLNQNEIINWLPITRLIARLMIRNQFDSFFPR